jgi:hypothetical protein
MRTNRWAATCATCGGRVAPREGVVQTWRGVRRTVHHDCSGPVFGTAPRPRTRAAIERPQHPVPRRGLVGAIAVLALGGGALVTGTALSDGPGRPVEDFAIVDFEVVATTSSPPTTAAATAPPTAAPTSAPAVEVAAAVVTHPPAASETPREPVPEDEDATASVPPATEAPATTPAPTTVAPAPTTTAASTTTTTTTEPERRGPRECDDDDRRGRCRGVDDDSD